MARDMPSACPNTYGQAWLKQSNSLGEKVGKLSSIPLLNKIYEKGLQTILPQVCVVLRLFVSIPVSVASGERSFSKPSIELSKIHNGARTHVKSDHAVM
jgi:hypothetical protein